MHSILDRIKIDRGAIGRCNVPECRKVARNKVRWWFGD